MLALCLGAFALTGCVSLEDQQNVAAIAREHTRKEEYIRSHPKLSPARVAQIRAGQVQIGMTSEEVFASLGNTDTRNTTTTAFGTHEQWGYGGAYIGSDMIRPSNLFLYFDNNILTSIQELGGAR